MKKKIMVFMMLLSMLVGVGVPVQAKAEEIYDVTIDEAFSIIENDYLTDEHYEDRYKNYIYYVDYSYFSSSSNLTVYGRLYSKTPIVLSDKFTYYAPYFTLFNSDYLESGSSVVRSYQIYDYADSSKKIYKSYDNSSVRLSSTLDKSASFLLASNHVICDDSGNVVFKPKYTFEEWCIDAGLSCSPSSNESDSVVPFFYEPDYYNYIVRKTLTASSTSGVYQVTVLQKSDGAHYPYYFEVNDIGYLGVAGSFASTSTFTLRNYYYDADGNGWKRIERFDISTLPFDNTNVTFTDDVVFIYSDTDIYANREASSIWQPASTEYYNVDIPEPEITRVPIGGGTSVGGQAEPGGLLSFVISFFTLVWTELFAVEVPVDGYMISFQQIIIWGAIATVLGFLVFSIFKKR